MQHVDVASQGIQLLPQLCRRVVHGRCHRDSPAGRSSGLWDAAFSGRCHWPAQALQRLLHWQTAACQPVCKLSRLLKGCCAPLSSCAGAGPGLCCAPARALGNRREVSTPIKPVSALMLSAQPACSQSCCKAAASGCLAHRTTGVPTQLPPVHLWKSSLARPPTPSCLRPCCCRCWQCA